MPEAVTERPAKRRSRRGGQNRILDPAKVEELATLGVKPPDIAKHQGVSRPAIVQFLERHQLERKAVEEFRQNRADLLSRVGALSLSALERGINSFQQSIDDGVFDLLSPTAKAGALRDMAVVHGTIYDKERLERGQSTENVSVMGKVIADVQGGLFKNQQVTEEVARPTKAHYSGNRPEGDPSGEKPGAGGPDGSDVAIGS
jgi:hypothetical protein